MQRPIKNNNYSGVSLDVIKTKIWEYIITGKTQKLQELITDSKFPINEPITDIGTRAIHQAVLSEMHDILQILIECFGADVNLKDAYGKAPLHLAASSGNEKAIDFLIKHGANIDSMTNGHETPAMKACMGGFENILKKLLFTYKCDPKIRNSQNKSIFDLILIFMGKEKFTYYVSEAKSAFPDLNINEFISHTELASSQLKQCLTNIKLDKLGGEALSDIVHRMLESRSNSQISLNSATSEQNFSTSKIFTELNQSIEYSGSLPNINISSKISEIKNDSGVGSTQSLS